MSPQILAQILDLTLFLSQVKELNPTDKHVCTSLKRRAFRNAAEFVVWPKDEIFLANASLAFQIRTVSLGGGGKPTPQKGIFTGHISFIKAGLDPLITKIWKKSTERPLGRSQCQLCTCYWTQHHPTKTVTCGWGQWGSTQQYLQEVGSIFKNVFVFNLIPQYP